MTTQLLEGWNILVAEDEGVAALALCHALELEGASVVGPVATVAQATLLARTGSFGAAVLDIDLRGERCFDTASVLCGRQVPVVFVTGCEVDTIPPTLGGCSVIAKPTTGTEIAKAVARVVHARRARGHSTM